MDLSDAQARPAMEELDKPLALSLAKSEPYHRFVSPALEEKDSSCSTIDFED